jgi:hypothetical protein
MWAPGACSASGATGFLTVSGRKEVGVFIWVFRLMIRKHPDPAEQEKRLKGVYYR